MKKQKTVLIADDDASIRTLLSLFFEEANYKVLEAEDGEKAWQILKSKGADLGIFDLNMPNLDGLELTARIRKDERQRDLPILMLTVKGLVNDQIKGLKRGVDEYVAKPFEKDVLMAKVRALERRMAAS